MELDPAHDLAIKRLAKARFDGDTVAAYEAVIENGIEHTPIPQIQRPSLTPDGEPRIHYTERQNRNNPCLPAARYRPSYDNFQVLQTEGTGSHHFQPSQLLSDLALICQYEGVNHNNLAFSIGDYDGNWYGWGINTLATALQETATRYENVGRDPGSEIVEFLLPLRDSWLHFRAGHKYRNDIFDLTVFNFYTEGDPVGYEPYLQAIAAQFNRQLTVSKPVRQTFSFADSIPVNIRKCLTGPDGKSVTRFVIECPKAQLPEIPRGEDQLLPAESSRISKGATRHSRSSSRHARSSWPRPNTPPARRPTA